MGSMQKRSDGRNWRKAVLGSLVGITTLTSTHAFAADPASNEKLQEQLASQADRISALENKLDSLIELLTNSPFLTATNPAQPSASAATVNETQTSASSTSTQASVLQLKPGIYVDFHLTNRGRDWDDYKADPTGPVLSTFLWNKGLSLPRVAVAQDNIAKSMAASGDKEIAMQAKGVIEIAEPGNHVFALSLKNESSRISYCGSALFFDGKKVAETKVRYQEMTSSLHEADLSPGFYEISVWQTCVRSDRHDRFWESQALIETSVAMKAPSDRAMQPISANMIGHLE